MNESKRDYFAGLAMQALVTELGIDEVAESAYELADAMLMERKASSNTIKGRVEELEAQCKWAADQFQAIADSIASNSVGAAPGHALSCAADMEAALSDVIRSK